MKPLRIAIIADPFIPVPPTTYGGIERIIDFLVAGLLERGHDVTLLAHKDSKINGTLVAYGDQTKRFKHFSNVIKVNELRNFNPMVIHSFGRLAYLLPFLYTKTPKLMSYQREPTLSQIKKALQLAKKDTLQFTGCSAYISDKIQPYAPSKCIFNGVNLDLYDFSEKIKDGAPLVFLGRIEPIKGTHTAIAVAKSTNQKLVIAGNISSEHQGYFDEKIKPELNSQIKYIGPVNDEDKNELLRDAAALLMPIEWNEPFGIVMAEALACGTPIIGFDKGAVKEVIKHGINGFLCSSIEEMIQYVPQIGSIDRQKARTDAEQRFASQVIVDQYLALYDELIQKNVG